MRHNSPLDFGPISAWSGGAWKRYEALSEFLHDLRYPNADFVNASSAPLIERNPLLFWKGLSAVLVLVVVVLLAVLQGHR